MAHPRLVIQPVTDRRQVKDFVLFPFRLYRDDPYWVPPLIGDRMDHFDPAKNPFFEHAEVQLFRALRDGETVGTIAAIADDKHVEVWHEPVGFFGEFECIDDPAVAHALLDAAREWLAAHGREVMRGPLNMNINEEVGLLVDGFDGPPVVMMTYNPPYYQCLLEGYGLTKAKDLHAYKVDISAIAPDLSNISERVKRMAKISVERYKVQMRQVNLKDVSGELEHIKKIYRTAWEKNWGAIPMTDAEMDHLAEGLVKIADPRLLYLAFIDDQPVGVFLALPDLNQVAIHMGGRLLPFGWLKFLWYRRKINGLRVMIMGVLEEHRLKGIEALFYVEAARRAKEMGIEWGEMSWILEDNFKVRRGIETMGGWVYRTYRLYDIPTTRDAEVGA